MGAFLAVRVSIGSGALGWGIGREGSVGVGGSSSSEASGVNWGGALAAGAEAFRCWFKIPTMLAAGL